MLDDQLHIKVGRFMCLPLSAASELPKTIKHSQNAAEKGYNI